MLKIRLGRKKGIPGIKRILVATSKSSLCKKGSTLGNFLTACWTTFLFKNRRERLNMIKPPKALPNEVIISPSVKPKRYPMANVIMLTKGKGIEQTAV